MFKSRKPKKLEHVENLKLEENNIRFIFILFYFYILIYYYGSKYYKS